MILRIMIPSSPATHADDAQDVGVVKRRQSIGLRPELSALLCAEVSPQRLDGNRLNGAVGKVHQLSSVDLREWKYKHRLYSIHAQSHHYLLFTNRFYQLRYGPILATECHLCCAIFRPILFREIHDKHIMINKFIFLP